MRGDGTLPHTTPTPARQIISPDIIQILVGPLLQFLTPVTSLDTDFCLIKATIPSGMTVPIHSHDDRELFYVLSGEFDGLLDDGWRSFRRGDVFDVIEGARHAIRNLSGENTTLFVVTTMKLGRFFQEVGRAVSTVPLPAPTALDLERFTEVAHRYGYWLGDTADNAAVGIEIYDAPGTVGKD